MDKLIKENSMLQRQLRDQNVIFNKLQEDMSFLASNHETEVKLRL